MTYENVPQNSDFDGNYGSNEKKSIYWYKNKLIVRVRNFLLQDCINKYFEDLKLWW